MHVSGEIGIHPTDSTVQAGVWLNPDQVDTLRTTVYCCRPDSLRERNDTILTLMYDDTSVCVGELVAIDTEHLREDNSVLYLPGHLQKDYPTDNSPNAARLGLAMDTTRTLTRISLDAGKTPLRCFPLAPPIVSQLKRSEICSSESQPRRASSRSTATGHAGPPAMSHSYSCASVTCLAIRNPNPVLSSLVEYPASRIFSCVDSGMSEPVSATLKPSS